MDLVELTFKDQYIGRGDMWRLKKSLVRPLLPLGRVQVMNLYILFAVKEKKCFAKCRKPKTKTVPAAPEDLVQ